MKIFNSLLKVWDQPACKRFILFIASIIPDKTYVKLTAKGKLGYSINLAYRNIREKWTMPQANWGLISSHNNWP